MWIPNPCRLGKSKGLIVDSGNESDATLLFQVAWHGAPMKIRVEICCGFVRLASWAFSMRLSAAAAK
jgi:hypothetical protein